MIYHRVTSQAAGYTVEVLEYHDAKGEYHKADYSEESGRVSRYNTIE